MTWEVVFTNECREWLKSLEPDLYDYMVAKFEVLKEHGPNLHRPLVDTLKVKDFPNLKEFRIQYKSAPYRLLFVMDPKRKIVFLVGGNKRGQKNWYKKMIPQAITLYKKYLKENVGEKFYG